MQPSLLLKATDASRDERPSAPVPELKSQTIKHHQQSPKLESGEPRLKPQLN